MILKIQVKMYKILAQSKSLNQNAIRVFSSNNPRSSNYLEKSVFISQSKDIFANLALEKWILKNSSNLDQNPILFLWANSPCIILGKNSNPWTEIMLKNKLPIARRSTRGEIIVQNDQNSHLNCTSFTDKNGFNRQVSEDLVGRVLKQSWNISGWASYILKKNTYHHCAIEFGQNSTLEQKNAISSIGLEYLKTDIKGQVVKGGKFLEKQRGFQLVNPTNEWFEGLDDIKRDLKSWNWIFGKTPRFSIEKVYPSGKLNLTISNGLIESCEFTYISTYDHDSGSSQNISAELSSFLNGIRNQPYSSEIIPFIDNIITGNSNSNQNQNSSKLIYLAV